jgi:hypothetical protein
VPGVRVHHHGSRPTAGGTGGIPGENGRDARLERTVNRQRDVAFAIEECLDVGMIGLVALPEQWNQLAIVPANRRDRPSGSIG